jgi:signal peptidase I
MSPASRHALDAAANLGGVLGELGVQEAGVSTRGKMACGILGAGFVLAGAVALFVFVTFDAYTIPSLSMEPAYGPGSRVLARSVTGGDVERGDVVIAQMPAAVRQDLEHGHTIRRVVALGGDKVEARSGDLYVNDQRVDENYLEAGTQTDHLESTTVPEGSAFLLGDDRNNSYDSRRYGPLPLESIEGEVVADWPMDWVSLGVTVVMGVAFGITFVAVYIRSRRSRPLTTQPSL